MNKYIKPAVETVILELEGSLCASVEHNVKMNDYENGYEGEWD